MTVAECSSTLRGQSVRDYRVTDTDGEHCIMC